MKQLLEKIVFELDEGESTEGYMIKEIDSNDNATLYKISYDGSKGNFSCEYGVLMYNGNDPVFGEPIIFTQQENGMDVPVDMTEVAECGWVCLQNRQLAIMINGMPKLMSF